MMKSMGAEWAVLLPPPLSLLLSTETEYEGSSHHLSVEEKSAHARSRERRLVFLEEKGEEGEINGTTRDLTLL